jgi:vomeronasal1 receptor
MSAHDKSWKTTEEVALQLLLLCQFGVGTVANVVLFVHNFSPTFTGSQQRPTQVILSHMIVAKCLDSPHRYISKQHDGFCFKKSYNCTQI